MGMGHGALVIGVFKEGGSSATSSIRDLNDLTDGCCIQKSEVRNQINAQCPMLNALRGPMPCAGQ